MALRTRSCSGRAPGIPPNQQRRVRQLIAAYPNAVVVCGDRHWQYHAQHPMGIEEFSCGALVDNNSRAGRMAGDPKSTDPDALIEQYYVQGTSEEATGGFLYIKNTMGEHPQLYFEFYDDMGILLYKHVKTAL